MAIEKAEIRAIWLHHGLVDAFGSVVSGLIVGMSLTHFYNAVKTADGWYCMEKHSNGRHLFHGPFASSREADRASVCWGKWLEELRNNSVAGPLLKLANLVPLWNVIVGDERNVSVKREISHTRRTFSEVRAKFSGSSEYKLCFEAMNCKGFAEKVMDFLEEKGDASNPFGFLPKMETHGSLRMHVGRDETRTFSNCAISEVKHEYGGVFYKQRVYVTVTTPCQVSIRDASSDVYSLTCISTGSHYVDYNSSSPDIVQVSWCELGRATPAERGCPPRVTPPRAPDSSGLFGIFAGPSSTDYLNMNVGRNCSRSFNTGPIRKVRHEFGGWYFKQRVYVTVSRSCHLTIRDASGDTYALTCCRSGEHYVDYNSSNPTIVRISW